jgi:hypothetical protein
MANVLGYVDRDILVPTNQTSSSARYLNGNWIISGGLPGSPGGSIGKHDYHLKSSNGGASWSQVNYGVTAWFRAFAYGGGTYVALAQYNSSDVVTNVIRYSSDLVNWSSATGASSQAWNDITYGNGAFVAVCSASATAQRSTDGVSWSAIGSFPSAGAIYSIRYVNNLFICGADSGTSIFTSSDGITWNTRTAATSGFKGRAAYGASTYVIPVSGTAFADYSSDGVTWNAGSLPVSSSWNDVEFGNNVFVAMTTSAVNFVATSSDGITWTQRTLPKTRQWAKVVFDGTKFVLFAWNDPIALTSTDGITWSENFILSTTTWNISGAALPTWSGEQWVISNSTNQYTLFSKDGVYWGGASFSNYSSEAKDICANTVTGRVMLATGSTTVADRVRFSTNHGLTWSSSTTGPTGNISRLAFGNNIFVGLVDGSNVFSSPDGVTWTSRTNPVSASWSDITYGSDKFVAVGIGTTNFIRSTDGITWTSTASGYTGTVASKNPRIAFGASTYVVVWPDNDKYMTSSDGVSWTERTFPVTLSGNTATTLEFTSSQFIVTTATTTAYRSSDGINWTSLTLPSVGSAYDRSAASPTQFLLAGGSGLNKYAVSSEYHVSGTVLNDAGNGAARQVYVYDRTNGKLVGSQMSSGAGAFDIVPQTFEDVFIVVLDDDAGAQYNAKIQDRITPDIP